ncbi:hypothetical protein Syun_014104 [Stephania yunnanensis]|uniref:Uncharacterized protein n=1 Tax=Stephania yunnanensis TaxID=152371 RepID=A0AAP0JIX5_9MAGN
MASSKFWRTILLIIHEGETLAEVKVLQKKLQVPNEEFSKASKRGKIGRRGDTLIFLIDKRTNFVIQRWLKRMLNESEKTLSLRNRELYTHLVTISPRAFGLHVHQMRRPSSSSSGRTPSPSLRITRTYFACVRSQESISCACIRLFVPKSPVVFKYPDVITNVYYHGTKSTSLDN